jgi:hypothetical protein
MVGKGAKNLSLLLRSGPTSQTLFKDLRGAGVMAEAPRCDVSSEESLRSILQSGKIAAHPEMSSSYHGSES